MALKRKRSSPSFSSPSTTISSSSDIDLDTTSSIPFFYPPSKAVLYPQPKATWHWPTYEDAPADHYISRTRKRHRDDRPDEGTVYASTVHKLFDAQRRFPNAEPMPSRSDPTSRPQTATSNASFSPRPTSQKSNLHAFWNIARSPKEDVGMMDVDVGAWAARRSEMKCEDCDGFLQADSVMNIDEGVLEQEMSCGMCGRRVCDTCAFHGDLRVCLGCAR
ncbi:hypothetical protein EJ03DRAFT_290153 [Teratosphaeria nubilosa]|uniref:Uncharacterized protein n=1 Tax=Teratosphaeria nubilosa TaxID=161662 RepID=A0A6G1LFW7_9PEZI|nr:hypothetical protein EJ03DRAFT_290153 [Teratosphaeria nubilosa]